MSHNEIQKETLERNQKNRDFAMETGDVEVQLSKTEDGTAEKAPLQNSEVPAGEEDDSEKIYPPAKKVVVVMIALYLSLFLVSLVSRVTFHNSSFPHSEFCCMTGYSHSLGSNYHCYSRSCHH
jgi:hypothetical protein